MVLSNEEDFKRMKEEGVHRKISILECPKFWREPKKLVNSRAHSLERHVKHEIKTGLFV